MKANLYRPDRPECVKRRRATDIPDVAREFFRRGVGPRQWDLC